MAFAFWVFVFFILTFKITTMNAKFIVLLSLRLALLRNIPTMHTLNRPMKFYFLLTFFVLNGLFASAQSAIEVTYLGDSFEEIERRPKTEFEDSLALKLYLKSIQSDAREKGYLLASWDEVSIKAQPNATATFYLGTQFDKAVIEIAEKDLSFLELHTRINERILSRQAFQPKQIDELLQTFHACYLNNGYPFAQLKLTPKSIDTAESILKLEVTPFQFLVWGDIQVKGDSSISAKYLSNALQIRKGKPYSEKRFNEVSKTLAQINFIQETRGPEILFTPDGAELYVYVKSKEVNSINGFLGLQPNADNTKYQVNGEINLQLLNALKRGESLSLDWRNLQGQTQQLQTQLTYPYLFNSTFGLKGAFELYKRDTSFLELKSKIAVQYQLDAGQTISFFYRRNNSAVLGGAQNNPNLANLANVSSNNYGLGYQRSRVDYIPNPRSGFVLEAEVALGQRTSQRNDSSVVEKSTQVSSEIDLSYYIPLAARHVLRLGNYTRYLETQELFQNELYRFGGLLTQRGFNEDEFFASRLSIFTVEYRFLLDKNSRVFAFFDQSWYENRSLFTRDIPFGFGAGFAFATDIGTFSILYALGSQQGNPIQLSDGKIHFGYLAFF